MSAPARSTDVDERNDSARAWASSVSRSVWRWQLVLAASVVGIAMAMVLLDTGLLGLPQVAIGITTIVLATCAALAVPWYRLPPWTIALVPLVDIAAVGALAWDTDARLSFLWVFPISWIATYYSAPLLFASLAWITGILIADGLVGGIDESLALRVVIVALSLTFIGITISAGSRRTRAYRRLLERQFAQTGRTLSRIEAQYRRGASVVDAVGVPLAGIGFDGRLLTANASYRELYQIDDVRAAGPTPAVEYDDHEGTALPPGRTTRARAAAGEILEDERIWLFDAAGEWHTLDVSTRRIEAGSREPESMLIVAKDVTAVIRAERERRSIASIVSHELRNPLTAIVGRTDLLLERDDLPEGVRSQLESIENAGGRMERLIGEALDSARPAAAASVAIDLADIVAASVEAFRPAAAQNDVTMTDAGDSLPVTGDAFRLRQAIDNVVGNAVKYTPRGGRVDVTRAMSDGRASVVVADTGIGMAPADLDRIFEPYFRAQSALDGDFPGTGLGMGITRQIIEQQGGTLDIESELGRGTRVTLRLPAGAGGTA